MGKDKKPIRPIETTAAYRGGPCMLDVCVVWSLPKLGLTETQLVFAMLLTVGVMVQMAVAGMVVDIHRWLKEHREES